LLPAEAFFSDLPPEEDFDEDESEEPDEPPESEEEDEVESEPDEDDESPEEDLASAAACLALFAERVP
jgi:hypothetical protein